MRRDLSRAELIAIVEELRTLDPTEPRSHDLFAVLDANVPYPGGPLDAMVYGYDYSGDDPNPSADAVVDRALGYEPLVTLPPRG